METVTKSTRRYRAADSLQKLIGLSISYEREPLLARGLGLEHLRELLVRLARPLLRTGANLAYGGSWLERKDNFTYELLRLISAEQEDTSLLESESNITMGRLVNHLCWPHDRMVTPRIEARWIHCCHIVRITQKMAGIPDQDILADDAPPKDPRYLLNSAITLSVMRRLATQGMTLVHNAIPTRQTVPAMSARILLGGKLTGFSGFMPGVLEEARLAVDNQIPLYVLGGFGGASEALSRALLTPESHQVPELQADWHFARTPALKSLQELALNTPLPLGTSDTVAGFAALAQMVDTARSALSSRLNTGLDEDQTREMMSTTDARRATELVLTGMSQRLGFEVLPN